MSTLLPSSGHHTLPSDKNKKTAEKHQFGVEARSQQKKKKLLVTMKKEKKDATMHDVRKILSS